MDTIHLCDYFIFSLNRNNMVICNLPSVGMYYIFLDCVFGLKQLLQITFSVRGLRIDGAERLLLLTAHINTVFWQTFFSLFGVTHSS